MGKPKLTAKALRRRFARNMRRLREEQGLTLEAAAELADLNWKHWQKIETGEVNATLKTMVRMANALDVDLVILVEEPPPGARARGR